MVLHLHSHLSSRRLLRLRRSYRLRLTFLRACVSRARTVKRLSLETMPLIPGATGGCNAIGHARDVLSARRATAEHPYRFDEALQGMDDEARIGQVQFVTVTVGNDEFAA